MASASIGDPQSLNLFAYTRNNPVDFVDPSGLNASGCWAEFSSCGGGWNAGDAHRNGYGFGGSGFDDDRAYDGMSPTLRRLVGQHEERLENTYDAIDANRALQRYISSEGTDAKALEILGSLLESNSTLSIQVVVETHAWIIPSIDKLEELVEAGGFDKCNPKGKTRQCAAQPQLWSLFEGFKVPPTRSWIMGEAVHPGLKIKKGTVLATFNRSTGRFENKPTGNHTVIFLRWHVDKGVFYNNYYAEVLEQGPNFAPRKRKILYSRFTGRDYFYNIWYYNVVTLKNK